MSSSDPTTLGRTVRPTERHGLVLTITVDTLSSAQSDFVLQTRKYRVLDYVEGKG